eukprot:1651852-Pyramimonas_sp.AAC.1
MLRTPLARDPQHRFLAQALHGRSATRRQDERRLLIPPLRQRAVLALQEARGTISGMALLANPTEHAYCALHSQVQTNREKPHEPQIFCPSAGGVGCLAPCAKVELTRQPEE